MKWVLLIIVGIPLFICGFLRSPETMVEAAKYGIGLFVLAGFGSLIAPSANTTAYFDSRTGRQVTQDGKPIYSLTEDVARFGRVFGFLWCAIKFIFLIVLGGSFFGMFCYGGYSVIKLVIA